MKRAALFVALLAGCSVGGEEKTIDDERLDELVLQRDDVAPDLRPTYVSNLGGRPVSTVRFAREGTALSIESSVQVLDSRDAAEERLEAERDALDRTPDWQPIDEPGLGDESFAATVHQAGLRRYEVFWREHNAAASLTTSSSPTMPTRRSTRTSPTRGTAAPRGHRKDATPPASSRT